MDHFTTYWKDDGKTHKKYIGKYPPPIEKTSKDDDSSASKVTVTDPSNSTEDI